MPSLRQNHFGNQCVANLLNRTLVSIVFHRGLCKLMMNVSSPHVQKDFQQNIRNASSDGCTSWKAFSHVSLAVLTYTKHTHIKHTQTSRESFDWCYWHQLIESGLKGKSSYTAFTSEMKQLCIFCKTMWYCSIIWMWLMVGSLHDVLMWAENAHMCIIHSFEADSPAQYQAK